MAPIVTTGVLIVGKKPSHASSFVLGAMLIFQYRSTGDPQFVRVILAPEPCNFFAVSWSRNFRNAQRPSSCFALLKNMPDLSTNTYTLELCVSSLHRGHAQLLQILDVSQGKTGAMLLFFQNNSMYVSSCTKAMQNFSAQKKNVQLTPCRRENRHSCEGSPILCGRLFRDIRTFGRAVEGSSVSPLRNTMGGLSGCRRGATHQESVPLLHSSISRLRARALALDLDCGTCCPPFVMRKAYTIEGSSTPRRKSQPCVRLYCSTRCARRSTSLSSVPGASMLLARGGLLGRGRTSSPLSAAAVLLPALPREGE